MQEEAQSARVDIAAQHSADGLQLWLQLLEQKGRLPM